MFSAAGAGDVIGVVMAIAHNADHIPANGYWPAALLRSNLVTHTQTSAKKHHIGHRIGVIPLHPYKSHR
jgi:hypothetical protein